MKRFFRISAMLATCSLTATARAADEEVYRIFRRC